MDAALRSAGVLSRNVRVAALNIKQLEGGTHYKVARVQLKYKRTTKRAGGGGGNSTPSSSGAAAGGGSTTGVGSGAGGAKSPATPSSPPLVAEALGEPQAPHSVVIKILNPPKLTLAERLAAFVRFQRGDMRDRLIQYLKSYHTEGVCYRRVGPLVDVRLPRVYYMHTEPINFEFAYLFEDVSHLSAFQAEGFRSDAVTALVATMAKLHASFWDQEHHIDELDVWDFGGYWTGAKRPVSDLAHMWQRSLHNLSPLWRSAGLAQEEAQLLTQRLQRLEDIHLREKVCALRPRTLIHGDFKITNLFVDPRTCRAEDVRVLDWQWVGKAPGATELAHFLCTSLHRSLLRPDALWDVVQRYHVELCSYGITGFGLDELGRQLALNLLDFFANTIVFKWSVMTPMDVAKYARKQRDGLHLRSVAHQVAFIRTAIHCAGAVLGDFAVRSPSQWVIPAANSSLPLASPPSALDLALESDADAAEVARRGLAASTTAATTTTPAPLASTASAVSGAAACAGGARRPMGSGSVPHLSAAGPQLTMGTSASPATWTMALPTVASASFSLPPPSPRNGAGAVAVRA